MYLSAAINYKVYQPFEWRSLDSGGKLMFVIIDDDVPPLSPKAKTRNIVHVLLVTLLESPLYRLLVFGYHLHWFFQ